MIISDRAKALAKGVVDTKATEAVDTAAPVDIVISDQAKYQALTQALIPEIEESSTMEKVIGLATEAGEGLTFGFLGEMVAAAKAATTEESYNEAKEAYEEARREFKERNPYLAQYAVPLEIAASLPTGAGLLRLMARAGVKSGAKIGATEAGLYGFGSGESFEERVQNAAVMSLAGFTVGKVVQSAITPKSAGGLKTERDVAADALLDMDDVALSRSIEQAQLDKQFTEVARNYDVKPLREAQTAGELFEGVKKVFTDFYDENVRGVSDNLWARVSPEIGALLQRANQMAMRRSALDFGDLTERLVPVIKIINESAQARGALLDYAAGEMIPAAQRYNINKVKRKIGNEVKIKNIDNALRKRAINNLMRELSEELNADHQKVLREYLDKSYELNTKLNKSVFGASFDDAITYLHTRLNPQLRAEKRKAERLTNEDMEDFFEDTAFKARTRGSYLRGDKNAPNPFDYDNPIVSDIMRLQKMQQLSEISKVYTINPNWLSAQKGAERGLSKNVPLSPKEFMDLMEFQFQSKGISKEGSAYARKQISDMIMGEQKAPHPLIQAMQSLAYASTLAGPMSAILNLADVPLLGAKYGGKAALEGAKSAAGDLKVFRRPPNVDLEGMGFNTQVYGEFINEINNLSGKQSNWMTKTAEKSRKIADFAMKGSGFAAMDRVGKRGVMRGVLKSAVDDAKANRLADNWEFYFNNVELEAISEQLLKHGTDFTKYTGKGKDLVEELMFAGLGQQQLISSAGRPSGWARNPNLRPLWALRGFVIKQQALALRETIGNIKKGKPEEAAKFLGRYALYGAGGYAVINEGRQMIFGDGEASAGGLVRGYGDAWVSLLTANTIGLNDYQYGKLQEEGLIPTLVKGSIPIVVSRPAEILSTAVEVIDGDRPAQAFVTEASPGIKQILRFTRNVAEATDQVVISDAAKEMLRKVNPEP